MTVRITIELEEVEIGGVKYLSNLHQSRINQYNSYYVENEGWKDVTCLNELKEALPDGEFDACVFVKVPTEEAISNQALWQRIQRHFPGSNVEVVERMYI